MELTEEQENIWNYLFVTFSSIAIALSFVLIFVAFGWYIVWKCFLSRFKFVRELLGGESGDQEQNVIQQPKTKRNRRRLQD